MLNLFGVNNFSWLGLTLIGARITPNPQGSIKWVLGLVLTIIGLRIGQGLGLVLPVSELGLTLIGVKITPNFTRGHFVRVKHFHPGKVEG